MIKYYHGVRPILPGYNTCLVEPNLGGLQWMEGVVPTPNGDIHVYCNSRQIKVKADAGTGTLRFKSSTKPTSKGAMIQFTGNGGYELNIEKDKEYIVAYTSK